MGDRRNPTPESFDVLAPDGYLHAMLVRTNRPVAPNSGDTPAETVRLEWNIGVEAPHTTLSELLMGASSEIAARGGGLVTWWRAGATRADDHIAARAGFTRDREQYQLRVSLPISFDPQHAPMPNITTFSSDTDAEAWLVANNAAFRTHPEQSGWDMLALRQRMEEPWFDPELFLVARDEPDGPIIAFNWLKIHDANTYIGEPRLGEIYVIGVTPEAQGRGLGYSLAGLGLRALHVRGISTAMLYVAADNHNAIALYRRLGFTVHRTDAAYCATVTAI